LEVYLPPPPPPAGKNTKNYLLVFGILILIIGIFSGLILAHSSIQDIFRIAQATPTPKPADIANLVLSPNNQVIVLSLSQSPSFSITLSQNGQGNIVFPCSVRLNSHPTPQSYSYGYNPPNFQNYGTINMDKYAQWALIPLQPQTISYVAVIQDSTGAIVTSNTVSVEYR
jgi:hypothetical protein